ncbi:MAG: T9SS type A sorting domain-containing protein, partial [Bacteroidota bacterium]
FNGLLPPEPMAWTKVFLGWTEPVILDDPGPLVVTLNAASQPGRSDVVLVPISEAEYFLVENRYRDPEADGLILRVWRDGVVREQRVQNGDTTFNSVDISGFAGGVVVGADNYDWALPGGVDEDENPLNGGILIWHIDERIIAEALSTNRINADPDRRGIDLEEADGAQDLGFPTQGFGPDFSVGTPFDFWYEDNPVAVLTTTGQEVRLYQNRFGPDTTPSSNTNAGSPSYRILEGFSAPGPSMNVRYVRGPDGITDAVVPLLDTNLAAQVELDESSAVFDQNVRLTALPDRPNELTLLAPSGGLQLRIDTRRGEVVESQQGGTAFATVEGGRLVTLIDVEGQTGVAFGRPDGSLGQPVIIPRPFEWQPPLVGLGDGRVIARSQDGQELLTIQEPGVFTFERVGPILGLTRGAAPGTWFQVQPEGITERGGTRSWSLATPLQEPVGQPVFGMDRQGVMGVIPLLESRQLLLVADGEEPQFVPLEAYVSTPSALDALPVLADLNRDGRLDVVVTLGTTLLALDRGGALLDGFPLPLPAQAGGQPLVTAGTQEAGSVVFVPTERGQLYAYPVLGATDASARTRIRVGDALVDQLPGFPLSIGRGLAGTPRFDGEVLTAVTTAGQLRQWAVPSAGAVRWGTRNGDDANASFITLADEGPEPPARLALLDEAGTYNWPNPITNGQTFIRVLPGADGAVEIDIFDLAGQRVDQVHLPTVQAGVPAEVAWQTSASSGVYMARVKLTTLDGQEAVELIKMAIIR